MKLVCLIGAGGIGSTLVHFLAPSLSKSKTKINFHIFDSDIVEDRNIQFQQFSDSDIGVTKVNCLSKSYSSGNFQIKANGSDLDDSTSLSCYDYVICAVDNAKQENSSILNPKNGLTSEVLAMVVCTSQIKPVKV